MEEKIIKNKSDKFSDNSKIYDVNILLYEQYIAMQFVF